MLQISKQREELRTAREKCEMFAENQEDIERYENFMYLFLTKSECLNDINKTPDIHWTLLFKTNLCVVITIAMFWS